MNPDENQSVNNVPTTAPEMNNSGLEPTQSSVPLVDAAVPPVTQPAPPTVADTISPEPQQAAAQGTTEALSEPEAPAPSGVVNATSPIIDNKAVEPTAEDPGHTLGVVGLVLAVFVPVVGLVVSIIAHSKSKKAGHKNGLALAGIIVSTIFILGAVLMVLLLVNSGIYDVVKVCSENGPGTYTINGVTTTCK